MLAITFNPSPAASMTSASIFSVTVGRMPSAPGTASSSSPRSGGLSERTVTSKPSRRRSPAFGLLPFRSLIFLSQHLAQDGLQDAAVTEVLDLDRGVHPRLYRKPLLFAIVARDLHSQLLARLEFGEAGDVEGFVAAQAEGFCVLAFCVLER